MEDTQIYIALSPTAYRPIGLLWLCIELVKDRMCQDVLQLNKDKTAMIVSFGAKDERLKVSHQLESHSLKTKNQDRNIYVIMDSDLNLSTSSHIKSVIKTASYPAEKHNTKAWGTLPPSVDVWGSSFYGRRLPPIKSLPA